MSGLAWSGKGTIKQVEVSADGGRTWAAAALSAPVLPRALTRFRIAWQWNGAPTVLKSRATDDTGEVQTTRDALVAAHGTNVLYHYNAIQAWQVDAAARSELVRQGYPEYLHAFGHHVGRNVHDGGSVLGPRWAYDGCHDPVLYTELLALIEGRAQAVAQSITDTPDHEVARSLTGAALPSPVRPVEVTDDEHGTALTAPAGATLRIHRVLDPTAPDTRPEAATGHVTGAWQSADDTRVRALFAVLYSGSRG